MRETPEFLKGSVTDLWCNVTGFPKPQIKWNYVSFEFDDKNDYHIDI